MGVSPPFLLLVPPLGANKKQLTSSDDLNNCKLSGTVYSWDSSVPAHAPLNIASCQMICISPDNAYPWQICMHKSPTGKMWRRFWSGSAWGDWIVMYDSNILTDSSVLSPLASALGAFRYIKRADNTDANTLTDSGYYFLGSGAVNAMPYSSLMVYSGHGWQDSIVQINIPIADFGQASTSKIRVRGNNNTWTAWQSISTDIPSFYKNYNDLSSLASALGDTKAFYYEPELISNADTNFRGIRRTNPSTTGAAAYGVIISYLAAGDLLQLWITNGDGVKYRCCTGATSFPQWTSL